MSNLHKPSDTNHHIYHNQSLDFRHPGICMLDISRSADQCCHHKMLILFLPLLFYVQMMKTWPLLMMMVVAWEVLMEVVMVEYYHYL